LRGHIFARAAIPSHLRKTAAVSALRAAA